MLDWNFSRTHIYGLQEAPGHEVQGLVTPNRLLVHLDEPYHVPQIDLGILAESSLLMTLEQHAIWLGLDEGDPLQL